MGLRAKLVTGTLLFTVVLVVSLSLVFLAEVLRERIAQTESANGVLIHSLLASARDALQQGVLSPPGPEPGVASFQDTVTHSLRTAGNVQETLDGLVRYSPDLQDAFISNASGQVLVSSNPAEVSQLLPVRRTFSAASQSSFKNRRNLLFGEPETLDISLPLDRNGQPFLVAHLGLRSTFLRDAYAPWLRTAAIVCAFALGGSLLVAAALSAAALRPIERIGRELERLSGQAASATTARNAVERVSTTISKLDAQMRISEQTRSEMATNLNSMLHALKDGVMLFAEDGRLVTASEATSHFLPGMQKPAAGTALQDLFPADSAVGDLLSRVLSEPADVQDELVQLEDGRTIAVSVDRGPGNGAGALLSLHDVGAELEFGRELQVSQRLASIGRLMTGVGHEVKNPINAMVLHLELLRGKLAEPVNLNGAQRHVEVLASEMSRLDRVVQTLADFSRPIEPVLRDQDLLPIVQAVIALIAEDAAARQISVRVEMDGSSSSFRVRCDAELLRQAMLNIALNAMQAMPNGGLLEWHLRRERQSITLAIRDNGSGIAPEALNRIFDLYFTTKPKGSGIGLAMTYRIVQIHGGRIQVRSEATATAANRGTTFTIELPPGSRAVPQSQQAVTL